MKNGCRMKPGSNVTWSLWSRSQLNKPSAMPEVFEAEAREHAVAALVGGSEIGHTRDTIPQGVAVSN